jgi:hypothetical protein
MLLFHNFDQNASHDFIKFLSFSLKINKLKIVNEAIFHIFLCPSVYHQTPLSCRILVNQASSPFQSTRHLTNESVREIHVAEVDLVFVDVHFRTNRQRTCFMVSMFHQLIPWFRRIVDRCTEVLNPPCQR